MRQAKKEFACNGTVVEHSEYGEVIQLQVTFVLYHNPFDSYIDILLQGDQRECICKLLVECGLVKKEQLKVHGF